MASSDGVKSFKSAVYRAYDVLEIMTKLQMEYIACSIQAQQGNVNQLLPLLARLNEFWVLMKNSLKTHGLDEKKGLSKEIRDCQKEISDLILNYQHETDHELRLEIKRDLWSYTWRVLNIKEKIEKEAKDSNLSLLASNNISAAKKLRNIGKSTSWEEELAKEWE